MTHYDYSALSRWNKWTAASSMSGIQQITDSMFDDLIQRATYDTTTAAHVNSLFGSVLFSWYNKENRWRSALPQVESFDWSGNVGDRIPKAMRVAHSPVQLDTHSEGGSISTARTFGIEEFSAEVKISETVLEESDILGIESVIEDAVGLDDLLDEQMDQLDLAIDREGIAASALESDNSTPPAYDNTSTITPLDRAIASQDEEANANDTTDTAFDDGALDYGNIDRSSVTWGDAYVDHNGTSGNRQLTRDLMDDFLNGVADNGNVDPWEESVIFTTRNSANILSDLMADSSRGTRISFDGTEGAGTDVFGGAETQRGLAGTTRFRHYDGIPIIPNQNGPTDGIGRIFVLPMSTINVNGQTVPRIGIEQFAEPYIERAGRGQPQGYIAQGNYTETVLFTKWHELMVWDMASCGKLRDLSE